MSFTTTLYFHILIGQVGGTCSSPNPFQWIVIVALVGAAGVCTVSTGVGAIAIASTIVTLLCSGASIAFIVAEIGVSTGTAANSSAALLSLVAVIRSILGC